ncbi:hypothetical protein DERF_004471 [Dermatophagoides farinae]|uniref:Uncharacterized protein n=1 Tax=Dermatophagoides farinae TaxID=6954 RepID=A0A922L572_DERFA|nr:hypothetical protein DERF_004471 [Dermatophagoides farinae]
MANELTAMSCEQKMNVINIICHEKQVNGIFFLLLCPTTNHFANYFMTFFSIGRLLKIYIDHRIISDPVKDDDALAFGFIGFYDSTL